MKHFGTYVRYLLTVASGFSLALVFDVMDILYPIESAKRFARVIIYLTNPKEKILKEYLYETRSSLADERPLWVVVSSGRCNTCFKSLCRDFDQNPHRYKKLN